jgi:hypothetical protein
MSLELSFFFNNKIYFKKSNGKLQKGFFKKKDIK